MSGVHESQPSPTEPSEKAPLREEGQFQLMSFLKIFQRLQPASWNSRLAWQQHSVYTNGLIAGHC